MLYPLVVVRLWRTVRLGPAGTPLWRCLTGRLTLAAWLKTVETHHEMVACGPELLRLPPGGGRVLWQAELEGHPLQLVLERCGGFIGEGQMALRLVDGADRVGSMAFTLGCLDGAKVVYAGRAHAPVSGSELANALQGLAPREFLWAGLRLLCTHLGVARVLTAADGDTELDDGALEFDLRPAPQRHALLARVSADIERTCGHAYATTLPLVRLGDVLQGVR